VKVCLASLHPRVLSGQIDSLAGLARTLDKRGHSVRIVAPFDTSRLLRESLPAIDSGPRSLAASAAAMLGCVPRVVKATRSCDLLHLALPTPAFSWLADAIKAAATVPVLTTFEGHLASGGDLARGFRRPAAIKSGLPLWGINNGLFGRLTRHACDHYLVSSHYQKQELAALGFAEDRVSVIPNIIETTKLEVCDPAAARLELGLPSGGAVVGYVGHFNDVKGVDVLAEAFRSLADARPDVRLVLAWSGQGNPEPVRRALRPVQSRVNWLGKVHVGTFLCAVDVLALPYRSTAGQGLFPSLILEAFFAGRPLVTTDLPLLREVAGDERVALLCQPDNPRMLAEQLDRALSSEPLRRRMSREQLILVSSQLAPDALVGSYEALYKSVLGAGHDRLRAAA
jgi:glycosyltransferase involved in cell wall biosynthesis